LCFTWMFENVQVCFVYTFFSHAFRTCIYSEILHVFGVCKVFSLVFIPFTYLVVFDHEVSKVWLWIVSLRFFRTILSRNNSLTSWSKSLVHWQTNLEIRIFIFSWFCHQPKNAMWVIIKLHYLITCTTSLPIIIVIYDNQSIANNQNKTVDEYELWLDLSLT
jgi:hypothetical protein